MSESWKNRLGSLLMICTFAVFLCGCGYKTIVLDAGDDKKEILLVGDTGFTSLSNMQVDAVEKAKNICEKDGKKYQFIDKRVQPQRFAVFPEVNIIFRCE